MASPKLRWRIDVTERDIERARRNDSYLCVVAQAIARTIPDATRIEVDTQAIRFSLGDERYVYLTPPSVQWYVFRFDAGDPLEPFRFQIDRPQISKRVQRTEAGKAVQRAVNTARRAAERSAEPADPSAAARAAYAAAAADVPEGEKLSSRSGRRPQGRVFRKRGRAYGHRLLRINQKEPSA
jgi:hypothetical protein